MLAAAVLAIIPAARAGASNSYLCESSGSYCTGAEARVLAGHAVGRPARVAVKGNTPNAVTICTAVAPDAVLTVRTYGTRPAYGPGLVRNFSHLQPRTPRSAACESAQSQNMAQLG
jgi:hypothetical protein